MALGNLLAAILAALILPSTQAEPSTGQSFGPSTEVAAQRGPAVFNAVYDSLHKWGCTVHPNGMSIFLATVPEGVLLHHGNDRNLTPTRPDWLAYEIEHAEMFARTRRPGPPRGPGKHMGGDRGDDSTEPREELRRRDEGRAALLGTGETPLEEKHGWLHTYRTTRPLRFLYVDGMSGDKGNSGVLDTQQYILRGDKDSKQDSRAEQLFGDKPRGPPGEYDLVLDLCDLCADWKLQGIIRTEGAGFEIIKCDFSDGLQEVQAMQRADTQGDQPPYHGPGGPGGPEGPGGPRHHLPRPGDRYRDIGSRRTVLDYSSMVSAFFFPVNLTNPDSSHPDLPRLSSTTKADRTAIREYLSQVVEARYDQPLASFTWKDIADLVVRRYAKELSSMADTNSTETLASRIRFLLEVFIDYSVADEELRITEAKDRCSTFYIQTMLLETEVDRLIYSGFRAVNAEICAMLFNIRTLLGSNLDDDATLKDVKENLRSLMDYLSWRDYVTTDSKMVG
ncbi:hypothetical protein BHE90_010842 [Fusarium euwallaceae]|uniref:Uncharacterized protein n=1 Tax=Fusarium euwallaceae TaxID=1147111 RepID=A0A430LG46_9HYPO|nr:hypothetical protein BHE90_010842 [Fusarium euwallaceae]